MLAIRSPRMLARKMPFRPCVTFFNTSACFAMQHPPPLTVEQSQASKAKWHERVNELEKRWHDYYQNLEARWYERTDKQNHEFNRELREKCDEIAILRSLALHEKTELLKLERNFNIRGALERTVYHAKLIKKIGGSTGTGIQAGIDELAKTPEFIKVFNKEIVRRGLALEDVASCVGLVYHQASKYAHGNDGMITIHQKDHTVNERAALAIVLMVQSQWPDGLAWQEVMEEKKC